MIRQVLCCIVFLFFTPSEASYDCVRGQTVDVTVGNSPVILSSPTNGSSSSSMMTCYWNLTAANTSKHVKLVTLRSNMQSTYGCVNYVQVEQGSTILRKWCDQSKPTVISSGRTLSLTYNTYNYHRDSFTVQLTQTSEVSTSCLLGTIVNVTAGDTPVNVTSPNYPGDYDSSSDCYWRIRAANSAEYVELKTMDMEMDGGRCSYDYVEVRDGLSQTDQRLKTWCGRERVTVYSSGDGLFLHFHSDISGQYRGFSMQVRQVSTNPEHVSMIVGITLGTFFIVSGFGIVCLVDICHRCRRRN